MREQPFSLALALGPAIADVPLYGSVDVLVAGGGSAGCAAAIAAARSGASVLLVERYGYLGGIGAGVLDTFYGFYTPGANEKVVGGIGDEIVAALANRDDVFVRPNTYGAGGGITYSPEQLRLVWDVLVERSGAAILLHSYVTDVVRAHRSVSQVLVDGKAGLHRIEARQFVDATGDADICARAGAGFDSDPTQAQALTTTFRLANVDTDLARSFPKDELFARMAAAAADGYALPRQEGSIHRTTVAGVSLANMTRVEGLDPTDPEALTRAEIAGRRQVAEYVRFLKDKIPGYGEARLVGLSTQIGIRESRRIHGDYQLTEADVLGARQFPDTIVLCGAPIEDHRGDVGTAWRYIPNGGVYGVPFRCLCPRDLDNVVVAGRCLSATHDAHASCRSIAQCIAMGQAAGTAAALASAADIAPRNVPTSTVQSTLLKEGAILATQ